MEAQIRAESYGYIGGLEEVHFDMEEKIILDKIVEQAIEQSEGGE